MLLCCDRCQRKSMRPRQISYGIRWRRAATVCASRSSLKHARGGIWRLSGASLSSSCCECAKPVAIADYSASRPACCWPKTAEPDSGAVRRHCSGEAESSLVQSLQVSCLPSCLCTISCIRLDAITLLIALSQHVAARLHHHVVRDQLTGASSRQGNAAVLILIRQTYCRAIITMPETTARELQMTMPITIGESCQALLGSNSRHHVHLHVLDVSNSDGSYYYSNSDGSTCELSMIHQLSASLPSLSHARAEWSPLTPHRYATACLCKTTTTEQETPTTLTLAGLEVSPRRLMVTGPPRRMCLLERVRSRPRLPVHGHEQKRLQLFDLMPGRQAQLSYITLQYERMFYLAFYATDDTQ